MHKIIAVPFDYVMTSHFASSVSSNYLMKYSNDVIPLYVPWMCKYILIDCGNDVMPLHKHVHVDAMNEIVESIVNRMTSWRCRHGQRVLLAEKQQIATVELEPGVYGSRVQTQTAVVGVWAYRLIALNTNCIYCTFNIVLLYLYSCYKRIHIWCTFVC